MRVCVVVVALCGCRQLLGLDDVPPDAQHPDTAVLPCAHAGTTACGDADTLQTCTDVGQLPTETACYWGCVADAPAHCGELAPSGGGVAPLDLQPDTRLAPVTLAVDTTIDDLGAINNVRTIGMGVAAGINFHIVNGIAVYTFSDLTISANVALRGTMPIALVATGSITVDGNIDVTGGCNNGDPGPGGGQGGVHAIAGIGDGGGAGGTFNNNTSSGGGGGGFGATGGVGGKSNNTPNAAAGGDNGTIELAQLTGGGGGGGGGGNNGGTGGGGGGAVQLAAEHSITISGVINAGGCGGKHAGGGGNYSGGGGGAGGAILIEAHDVALLVPGFLAVNGGGGGGNPNGGNGADAHGSTQHAAGGDGAGDGGATATIAGQMITGQAGNDSGASSGGGGGVGRIRITSKTGIVAIPANTTSPTPDENPTGSTIAKSATK